MNKNNTLIAVLLAAALLLGGTVGWMLACRQGGSPHNYSDEMKLEYRTNYADGGASTVERQGDHTDSPYFYHADFPQWLLSSALQFSHEYLYCISYKVQCPFLSDCRMELPPSHT